MKIKRLFVLLITIMMLFTVLNACANDAPGGGGDATPAAENGDVSDGETDAEPEFDRNALFRFDPPITLTVGRGLSEEMQQYVAVQEDVIENNNWTESYRELLGIEIVNEWAVPGDQYEERVNTLMAANDLPDLIAVNAQQLRFLVDNGMAADLTDVFERYANDFTLWMMEEDNWVGINQATFNGRLMAIPGVNGNADQASVLWIRFDWLEALGMEPPTTIDELINLAEAFMEANLADADSPYGIGISGGSGLLGGGWGDMVGFYEGFGINPNGWIDVDGRAEFGRIQPEIREALATMADMYERGIIHREFVTRDLAEDIAIGRVGIMYGQHWNSFWPLQDSINNDITADWIPVPIPTVDGSPGTPMLSGSAGTFWVVCPDYEHPEVAVMLLNYVYRARDSFSPYRDGDRYHRPGHEVMEHPYAAFQWSVIHAFHPTQNIFIHRGVMDYFGGDESAIENEFIAENVQGTKDWLEDPVANTTMWATYRWSGPRGAFSVINGYHVNGHTVQNLFFDITDSMVQFNTNLNDMAESTFTRIVMGVDPIEEFDNFVEQWWLLGGEAITNEVNEMIGR